MKRIIYAMAILLAGTGCTRGINPEYVPRTEQQLPPTDRTAFAKGADISWVTQMEN